jgi:nitrate reductase gamma subunit
MQVVQIVTYVAVVISCLAMIRKALKYATAPIHFRWELYPVPHEKGRSDYGGSYLEELDWWSKKRHTDLFKELKEMGQEILLLKGVFHHNKKVWAFSFPFHFGLYLCIGWLLLLLLGGILQLTNVAVGAEAEIIGKLVHYLTILCGYVGMIMAGFGAFGLFIWRLTDNNQKPYNAPAEYINLAFFDIVIIVALIAQFSLDPGFIFMRGYVQSLITFSGFTSPGLLFNIEIALIALMIMYVPLTRMSHFVAKYFLYHAVRWNDEPNRKGSEIEKKIMEMLNQRVSWKGPHIQTGEPWSKVAKEMKNE